MGPIQLRGPCCTVHAAQHPLVRTPSASLLQCSNGANKRQHRKTNSRWNGGAGQGRRKSSSVVCRLHKAALSKRAERRAGRGSKTRDRHCPLLFQSPAGTLLQSQHCPPPHALLSCSDSHRMDFGTNSLERPEEPGPGSRHRAGDTAHEPAGNSSSPSAAAQEESWGSGAPLHKRALRCKLISCPCLKQARCCSQVRSREG